MLHIYVDADACPVKPEIYRVARRCRLEVTLVANSWMNIPEDPSFTLRVVGDALDEADDWIAEHVQPHDIVITADIPLANRCVQAGARVLGPTGKRYTRDNIGDAVATRDLLADLQTRHGGTAPELADGGLPVRGLAQKLDPPLWGELEREMFFVKSDGDKARS
mgnify:CR=1 FL=1